MYEADQLKNSEPCDEFNYDENFIFTNEKKLDPNDDIDKIILDANSFGEKNNRYP